MQRIFWDRVAGAGPLGRLMMAMIAGLAFGVGSAAWIATHKVHFAQMQVGPWQADLGAAVDPDPYTRAYLAYNGGVALGVSEGLALSATHDDDGRTLRSDCHYRIEGRSLPGRFWTLTIKDSKGETATSLFQKAVVTSSQVLRSADGAWSVITGPDVRAGFYLPTPRSQNFAVLLHIYEPSVLGSAHAISREQLPHVLAQDCR